MMTKATVLAAIVMAGAIATWGCGPSQESSAVAPATPVPASSAKPPIGFLNTPAEKQVIAPGTFVSGWALADSGIAEVVVTFDDGQRGYVKVGEPFPGVKERYSSYRDADKAGYIFAIPKMSPGPHSLTVTVRAKDGGAMEIRRQFSIP